ncbi:MAG: NAD-dependent epimerase/dehydratase family protein [Alphaproteobacteria bacterium]|nr:NAD-dependent epimerase/dehydratase family protein [Alphaproteobacteria bacterium]
MKTVLITGANGFIGQRLSLYLRKHNIHVKGTCRTLRALPQDIEPIHIPDLCDFKDWLPLLKGVDTIYHLAAQTHGIKAGKLEEVNYTPAKLQTINVDTTHVIAQAAVQAGVKRFVYISSIKVNGDSTSGFPFLPTDPPKPEDNYGASKWQAEMLLRKICQEERLEYVIIRPPLVYGPGVKGNFLSLLRLCDSPWPLPLASIQNQRSLIYLDNLVLLLHRCGVHPAASGQTFLVRDSNVSIPTLVRTVRRYLRRPSRLFFCPRAILKLAATLCGRKEAFNRLAGSLEVDDQLCRHILDWTPPFTFEQGIKETVLWYKANKGVFSL